MSARVALSVFVSNRLVLSIVSILAAGLFYTVRPRARVLSDAGPDTSLGALWRRWDVLWYVRLADHGYHWVRPPAQSDLAFFPLYPLAMHALTRVSPLAAYPAGLVVSSASFLLALYLLHRLVARDFDLAVAERAVTYLGVFPTALFFFTAYAEALYLACTLGCVYALRLRRWWLAGACGMAAALTRQLGVLLLVPFIVEVLEARDAHPEGVPLPEATRQRWSWAALLPALLIPGGAVAFAAYLQVTLGNGLLFLQAQRAWERSFAPPWWGILLSVRHALTPQLLLPLRLLNAVDLSFLLLFLVLLLLGARRLPRSYTAYAGAVWLAVLVTPATGHHQPLALLSVSRFGVTLFPPFLVLALLGRSRTAERLILCLSLSLLAVFTVLFVRGHWVA